MKRILAIDGGGIKGVFPAAFLASLEDTLGIRVVDHFDLIAGTSTGGIIALGLGLGFSAQEILSFYTEYGPRIFPADGWRQGFRGKMRRWFASKHDSNTLRRALDNTFGGRQLGESSTRLLIPTLNIETGEAYIYKTAHHERFIYDFRQTAVEVALATSAAPTFLSTHRSAGGTPFIDGGLYANNPTGFAVVEAIGVLNWPREEIFVLSLSCTSAPLTNKQLRQPKRGAVHWVASLADVFMAAQSHASMGTAHMLIGHDHVDRICPIMEPGRFDMDNAGEIDALAGLGRAEARKACPALKQRYFSEQTDNFNPCHHLPN